MRPQNIGNLAQAATDLLSIVGSGDKIEQSPQPSGGLHSEAMFKRSMDIAFRLDIRGKMGATVRMMELPHRFRLVQESACRSGPCRSI